MQQHIENIFLKRIIYRSSAGVEEGKKKDFHV
jgi:hypothetical protein